MPIDQEKLKALKMQGSTKVGGTRGKAVSKPSATAGSSTSKAAEIISAVTRLGGKAIPQVSEVWMFVGQDQVYQFNNPKVVAAAQSNTWAITGRHVTKPIAECLPQALQHMGLENMGALQSMLGAMGGMPGMGGAMGGMPGMMGMPGMGMPGMGDDVPNFDEAEETPELVE